MSFTKFSRRRHKEQRAGGDTEGVQYETSFIQDKILEAAGTKNRTQHKLAESEKDSGKIVFSPVLGHSGCL